MRRGTRLPADAFEALVARALDELPPWVQEHMDNVAVMVVAWPSREQMRSADVRHGRLLLGLYEGVPMTRRGRGYNLVSPDRITLFQGPLELVARGPAELVRLVQDTVIHEIAHHFGFSDDDIAALQRR
ncbi:MAG TPA: metallopeptidase family protein [Chloroflexi bacterium]|jgi:predicted Zn-dependent protease with MMP-like domain|nr:metallopeptidase family protein [Chloroflexota bacterium]